MDDLRAKVESLVRERIGLNPQAVHRDHIEDAVRQRMTACGVAKHSQYLALLETNSRELQDLTELLVVVESWFFRDVHPFRFLEHYVRDDWSVRCLDRPLRLLSVPCGTGEEPFSMAMTLLNLGLDARRFRVDGVDISQRALGLAREGSYGETSFREREEPVADCRSRFFHAVGTREFVNDDVRAAVHFRQGNLVESAFLGDEERYDVIFCRNLLIYLDGAARRAALANLRRLLANSGVLYVGHVEGGTLRDESFSRCDAAYPFAFRVRQGNTVAPAKVDDTPRKPRAVPKSRAIELPEEKTGEPVVEAPADYDQARSLANRGRLDDAAAQCLELIKKHSPNAAVFALLGVVRQAQGKAAEAEKCFQKAVYLDPRHHESLVHLALLAAQRGDEPSATNYRRRAEKVKE